MSFWLLAHESRDLSRAEKKNTGVTDEQPYKMTTVFTRNGQSRHFE